ncbi:hypothetical protein B7463_g1237, partial [Scytalidium lignicola]
MFEIARDYSKYNTDFEIVGGWLSPVSDGYKKAGLAPATHRLRMCELAVNETSNWLMVDPWEAIQKNFVPTAQVLDHFGHEINNVLGGVERPDGTRVPVKVALLAGADLIQTMSTPGVWSEQDLDHILGRYKTFILERSGTDIDEAIASLQQWQENIYVMVILLSTILYAALINTCQEQIISNDVIKYIHHLALFQEDGVAAGDSKISIPNDKERHDQASETTSRILSTT